MRFCRVVQSCGGNAKKNDVMSCPPTSLFFRCISDQAIVRTHSKKADSLTAKQNMMPPFFLALGFFSLLGCQILSYRTAAERLLRLCKRNANTDYFFSSAYMPTWTIPGRTLLNTSEVVENPVARPDDASRVLQMVITAIIFLVGIPLNALVVWVLGLRRSHYKRSVEGRGMSSFRVYVVNLALADLMLLLRTPLMLGYLAHHKTWPFGLTVCRLIMFLRGLGLYANAFLLCAISMERCLCLMRPVWFRMRRSWWTVPLICAILWLLATSLSAPYIWTACLINGTQCWESTGTTSQGLFITESILGFLLPLVIFLSSNLAVLFTAQQAGQAMASSSSTSQRFVRLYRVLFFTMLFFLTCWVPYYTFRFLMKLAAEKPDWEDLKKHFVNGTYISLFLVYIKSALNPLIYVFATRGLRRTIQASLISTVDRIFNDDTSDYTRRKSLRRQDSQF